jgi:hypothetical protein
LAAIASGSKKNAANGDDAKKQVQTEPGTPTAQEIALANEFVKKVKGEDATSVTGGDIQEFFKKAKVSAPPEFGSILKYPIETEFTPATIAGNWSSYKDGPPPTVAPATGAKGNSETNLNGHKVPDTTTRTDRMGRKYEVDPLEGNTK